MALADSYIAGSQLSDFRRAQSLLNLQQGVGSIANMAAAMAAEKKMIRDQERRQKELEEMIRGQNLQNANQMQPQTIGSWSDPEDIADLEAIDLADEPIENKIDSILHNSENREAPWTVFAESEDEMPQENFEETRWTAFEPEANEAEDLGDYELPADQLYNKIAGLNYDQKQIDESIEAPRRKSQEWRSDVQTARITGEELYRNYADLGTEIAVLKTEQARYEPASPEAIGLSEQIQIKQHQQNKILEQGLLNDREKDNLNAPANIPRLFRDLNMQFAKAPSGDPLLSEGERLQRLNLQDDFLRAVENLIPAGQKIDRTNLFKLARQAGLENEFLTLENNGQLNEVIESANTTAQNKQSLETLKKERERDREDRAVLAAEQRIRNKLLAAARAKDGKTFAALANAEGINFENKNLLSKFSEKLAGFKIGEDIADDGTMRAYIAKWDSNPAYVQIKIIGGKKFGTRDGKTWEAVK